MTTISYPTSTGPAKILSPFTDRDAFNRIKTYDHPMAKDFVAQGAVGLTDHQWAWVHRLAVDAEIAVGKKLIAKSKAARRAQIYARVAAAAANR